PGIKRRYLKKSKNTPFLVEEKSAFLECGSLLNQMIHYWENYMFVHLNKKKITISYLRFKYQVQP
ncbi:MAG: hypothetical protein MUO40_05085, partial [Anaerolineaceae bacterium]|nr:hypothetical protein [Anaerolineaceae bacterium]